MKKTRDNYTFLTEAPVHKVVFTMAIPTIISMLSTSMYNLADTYFVGSINTQSVAAVGISFAMMAVIQAVGFFYGHGAGNYISRKLGAKEEENARKMATTGFVLSFLTGLVIAILGQLFLTPLCLTLGSTPTILPYTERYLGIILLGAPFMTTSLTLNNMMRFQGNTMYAMKGIMSGVLLNLILAPLLILYFELGITGAAIATLISQCFGCAILFWMTHKGQNIRIHLRDFTPSKAYAKEIIFGGTPSLSRQGLGSIATLVLNVAAGAYGDAAIAGMSIVTRISFFTYAVVIGLGQGFQPLCGFCYGARLYARVKEAFYYCIKCGTYPCQYRSCSKKRFVLHSAHLYPTPFLRFAGGRNVSGMGRLLLLCSSYSDSMECIQRYEKGVNAHSLFFEKVMGLLAKIIAVFWFF